VLAALNHPHIAAIYGVEEADGARALVLELVEGPTLAERLRLGAIPVRDALVMARPIAEARRPPPWLKVWARTRTQALETAHAPGVTAAIVTQSALSCRGSRCIGRRRLQTRVGQR
jgi:hypothetical protein